MIEKVQRDFSSLWLGRVKRVQPSNWTMCASHVDVGGLEKFLQEVMFP